MNEPRRASVAGESALPCAVVVDSSLTVRMDLQEVLRGAGLDCVLCATLAEGRAALQRGRAALLVVEESLADGSGADLAAEAVALGVPVLMLTEGEEAPAGDARTMSKPYDRERLGRLAAELAGPGDACGPRPRRVLAVDDSETYLRQVADEVAVEGVEVLLARSGEEALEMLARETVDCILLDLTMPGLSGEETCRRIRADARLREVPIIMLTADETRRSMLAGLSAGADDFLAKSEDFEIVRARLRVQLRRRRLEEEAMAARERILRLEEQRRSAAMLAENEARLRLTMEAADLGGWQCSEEGVLSWTPRAHELLGLAPDAPRRGLGGFLAAVRAEDREAVRGVLVGSGDNGNEIEAELRLAAPPDGGERWLLARGRRLGGEGNLRVLGILSDVTDRRNREEENRRLAAFQQQLMGIVGHDLRNPLSAILTSAEVLRQSAQEPAQVRTAERIRSSAQRASRMIGDLLDYTQASLGGGLPVSRRPADLHEIAEQVAEELRAANPDRRILCSCGSPAEAELDPDRMAQVISNLVSNALTYSPPGEKVEVEVGGDGERVELRVRNRGEPIPEELLPVLFEPFKRGDGPGAGKNVGLGLFIVREIVAAHGGTVEVTSTAHEGTSFRVLLPRRPAPV